MSSLIQRNLARWASAGSMFPRANIAVSNAGSSQISSRAPYATAAPESPASSFRIPTTESEVAELLGRAHSAEERKQVFEALLGTQKPVPMPSTPKGASGVHLVPIGRTKIVTDYVGIDVHHSPFESLTHTYKTTLKVIEKLPEGSVYRQAVQALTQQRLSIVEKYVKPTGDGAEAVEASVKEAEAELGVNLIEEAIHQAEDEHSLTLSILESEAWQDLQEKPAPGQWEYFPVPSSTSYPKD